MIYGNHDMRKSDVVKIAKWEDALVEKVARAYNEKIASVEDGKFYVAHIDYKHRIIGIIPVVGSKLCAAMYELPLDDTTLIRVGRLYEA